MTKQPTPDVTPADVERVVLRDFGPDRAAEVQGILEEYGTESWQSGPCRVRLAALKLAACSVQRLRSQIDIAKSDYRDVLLAAEYPAYGSRGLAVRELSADEKKAIIDADWQQYQEWLERP